MSIIVRDERYNDTVDVEDLKPNDAFIHEGEFFIVVVPLPSQNLDDGEVLTVSLNTGKCWVSVYSDDPVELVNVECIIKPI